MIHSAHILIVDDIESNRDILQRLVTQLGHTAIVAENGIVALSMIQHQSVDLVLLDIMMPEMDGYEVLSQIKDNPAWRHLPVIMITALDEMESVINCVKMGADDYLTKPFNSTLLKARIGACLERKYLRDKEQEYLQQIEELNHTLEERVKEKTKELAQAKEQLEKLNRLKDHALGLIYYEFQKPFQGIWSSFKSRFSDRWTDITRLLETIKQSALSTKIDLSTHVYPFELSTIRAILAGALESAQEFAQTRQVLLGEMPSCGGQEVGQEELYTSIYSELGDDNLANYPVMELEQSPIEERHKKLCAEAITELLKTAIKFSNQDHTVNLSCEPLEDEIVLGIHSQGRLIAEEILSDFFEPPASSKSATPGRHPGLGPSIARHIITSLGGSVTVENRAEEGISLIVKLKR
jgi:DNA-binding response OmpR family regulator